MIVPHTARFLRRSTLLFASFVVFLFSFATLYVYAATIAVVTPVVETAPVQHNNDAADDPAIWVNPADPASSIIIGTDKEPGGGLDVFDLNGQRRQFVQDGRTNNVDLRDNFMLGEQATTLVVASNVTNSSLMFYRINPTSRQLENIGASSTGQPTGMKVYGLCMYRSATSGKFYAFINKSPYPYDDPTANNGEYQQWEITDVGNGKVGAQKVRTFQVGSDAESCVADDTSGELFIAETKKAIWRYGAEPTAGSTRTEVDRIGSGVLAGELEGLTVYHGSDGTRYLIATNQVQGYFTVYRRTADGAYQFVINYRIGANTSPVIDGVSGTDGIDVTSANLGGAFSQGLFVAHDTKNDDLNSNFKLVPWQSIASLIAAAPTPTPSPTPPPTNSRVFTTIADAAVKEATPTTNYGAADLLGIDGGSDPDEKSYVRFAVSGLSGQPQRAILRVYTLSNSTNGPAVYSTTNAWDEPAITWNNAPAATSAALDDRGSIALNSWIEFDVSAAITGNGTYSFVIATDNADGIDLASRERSSGANAPQLVIETSNSRTFLPRVTR